MTSSRMAVMLILPLLSSALLPTSVAQQSEIDFPRLAGVPRLDKDIYAVARRRPADLDQPLRAALDSDDRQTRFGAIRLVTALGHSGWSVTRALTTIANNIERDHEERLRAVTALLQCGEYSHVLQLLSTLSHGASVSDSPGVRELTSPLTHRTIARATHSAAIADTNEDGVPDILVGHPSYSSEEHSRKGKLVQRSHNGMAEVLSGTDLEPLWSRKGSIDRDQIGLLVGGIGDVNADNINDVVVLRQRGVLEVRSGKNGSMCKTLRCSKPDWFTGDTLAVARLGDITADGHDDILLGAPGAKGGKGAIVAIDIQNDKVIWAWSPEGDDHRQFGFSVTTIPDRSADGSQNVFVGAPGSNNNTGRVYVLTTSNHEATGGDPTSGEDTHIEATSVYGRAEGDRFGEVTVCIDRAYDDGATAVAVGAPGAAENDTGVRGGVVYLYDPVSLKPSTLAVGARIGDRLGSAIASMSGSSANGRTLAVIGAPGRSQDGEEAVGSGYAILVSVPDGQRLWRLEANQVDDEASLVARGFGLAVALIGIKSETQREAYERDRREARTRGSSGGRNNGRRDNVTLWIQAEDYAELITGTVVRVNRKAGGHRAASPTPEALTLSELEGALLSGPVSVGLVDELLERTPVDAARTVGFVNTVCRLVEKAGGAVDSASLAAASSAWSYSRERAVLRSAEMSSPFERSARLPGSTTSDMRPILLPGEMPAKTRSTVFGHNIHVPAGQSHDIDVFFMPADMASDAKDHGMAGQLGILIEPDGELHSSELRIADIDGMGYKILLKESGVSVESRRNSNPEETKIAMQAPLVGHWHRLEFVFAPYVVGGEDSNFDILFDGVSVFPEKTRVAFESLRRPGVIHIECKTGSLTLANGGMWTFQRAVR